MINYTPADVLQLAIALHTNFMVANNMEMASWPQLSRSSHQPYLKEAIAQLQAMPTLAEIAHG